jgi:penicillin V acylase-like amidase (Ntn superfamily)
MNRILFSSCLLLFCISQYSNACTTFFLFDGRIAVFGRNYDWVTADGLLIVNKRSVNKASVVQPPNNPASWKSRYGSLTFNQYGREFPTGGMNEAGLVVELLWLDGTKYPVDSRPAVGGLEWIQYQLDMSASVAELIKNAFAIRIASSAPLHFLVADRDGNAATIEYLDGQLVTHQKSALPFPVLANSSYQDSLNYLKTNQSVSGPSSLDRFATASSMIGEYKRSKNSNPIDYAFEVLGKVAQPNTQWKVVYDLKNAAIHIQTKENQKTKIVRFDKFSFDCSNPVLVMDINKEGRNEFIPYSKKINLELIQSAYRKTDFLSDTPLQQLTQTAEHPEKFVCEEQVVKGSK